MTWTAPRTRLLISVAVAMGCGYLLVRAFVALHSSLAGGTAVDYLSFASAARLLGAGSHCVYCTADLARAQGALLGYSPPTGSTFPVAFVSPVALAWLLQPLAALSLQAGTDIFVLANVVAIAVAAALLIRHLQPSIGTVIAAGIVVAFAFSVAADTGILLGQIDGVLLLCVTGAMLLIESRHPWWAGILLAPLLLKPQLLWLAVPALLLGSQWRAAVPVIAGAVAVTLGGVLLVGASHLFDVFGVVGTASYHQLNLQGNTIPELLARPFGSDALGWAAAAAAGAAAVGAMAWQRHRLRLHPTEALAVGVAASVALSPHLGDYSLMLLAVPVAVLAGRRPAAAAALAALFTAATLAPFPAQQETSLVALALLAGVLWILRLTFTSGPPRPPTVPAAGSMVAAHVR